MKPWKIEARDPLVVRDGRPKQGTGDAGTLPFPLPGTVAGVVRTRAGSNENGAFVAHNRLDDLRKIAIRGPLLCSEDGSLYVPRPRDALFVATDNGRVVRALRPLPNEAGRFDSALTTPPVGLDAQRAIDGKPPRDLPVWWTWTSLLRWLTAPADGDESQVAKLLDGGIAGLPREHRTHVKIGEGFTAEDGMLFETVGLRMIAPSEVPGTRGKLRAKPLALSFGVEIPADVTGLALRRGVGPFAGERRLVRWSEGGPTWPDTLPDKLVESLSNPGPSARVRLLLLTPAIFKAGSQPGTAIGQMCESRDAVKVSLVASIVPRPETISGWDFAQDKPKGTTRVVPAGSVYWLEVAGTVEARLAWARTVWMKNVSDEAKHRNDGYGLAVLGVA